MAFKITDEDKGYQKLLDNVEQLKQRMGVGAGIFAAEGSRMHQPATTVEVEKRVKIKRAYVDGPKTEKVRSRERRGDASQQPTHTVLEIATMHEFGLAHIPERSFLRAWFDSQLEKNKSAMKSAATRILKGQWSAPEAMKKLGVYFQGQIQKRIAAGIPPANAPRTIANKGSSTPLIDTGQLRSSVTYHLFTGGRDEGPAK